MQYVWVPFFFFDLRAPSGRMRICLAKACIHCGLAGALIFFSFFFEKKVDTPASIA